MAHVQRSHVLENREKEVQIAATVSIEGVEDTPDRELARDVAQRVAADRHVVGTLVLQDREAPAHADPTIQDGLARVRDGEVARQCRAGGHVGDCRPRRAEDFERARRVAVGRDDALRGPRLAGLVLERMVPHDSVKRGHQRGAVGAGELTGSCSCCPEEQWEDSQGSHLGPDGRGEYSVSCHSLIFPLQPPTSTTVFQQLLRWAPAP